jgi:predicted HTH transcriptional regulator
MRIKDQDSIKKIITACKVTPSEQLESEEVEFKEYRDIHALHNAKDLAEEVSALANFCGGIIIIGIKDSSNVTQQNWLSQLVGFEQGDTTEIEQRLKGKLKPSLEIYAEYLDFESKFYLIIHVPHRRDSLITTSSGKVCIRDGRSSRPMEPDEVRRAVNNLQNYDWSADVLNLDVDNCLDSIALGGAYDDYCIRKNFSTESRPDKYAFLEAIGATNNGSLTKAGLLFLGKSSFIKQWLGTYEYRFSWKTRSGSLLINEVWEDCIWRSIGFAKEHFNLCNVNQDIKFKDKRYSATILDSQAFHEFC